MENGFLPQELSEVRAIQNEEGVWTIPMRSVVFNKRSRKLITAKSVAMKIGPFFEVIDPAALNNANFQGAISCWNHNRDYILGAVRNGTATYDINAEGMDCVTFPPDNPTIRDIVISPILRRDVQGSSFVFYCPPKGDEWVRDSDGVVIRHIKTIETVFEWGPVAMEAYLDTTAEIVSRSLDDFISAVHEQEKTYSSQFAKMRLALR